MPCCNSCIVDSISCLQEGDELVLNIGGLYNGDYFAVIEDAQGNIYNIPFTFDGSPVALPVGTGDDQLPPSLFNPYIGDLKLSIQETLGDCILFEIKVQTKCVQISCYKVVNPVYGQNEIGLPLV